MTDSTKKRFVASAATPGERLATPLVRARDGRPRFGAMKDLNHRHSTCMACGGQIAPCLARAGSPRCPHCRDAKALLRADLVEQRGHHLHLVSPVDYSRQHLPKAA